MHRWFHRLIGSMALALVALQAAPALACGGLVAPNGAVRLERATTLVAWHNGVEHYMTSFTYQGDVKNVGWIVPLPAVPSSVVEGGAWSLQRLVRESHPQDQLFFAPQDNAVRASAGVDVLQQVQIAALDITVLRGSGDAVLAWCASNGFAINEDTRAHLLIYAKGSPIFMAAKFDTLEAQKRHQTQGDGTPILITMPTSHIWVPFEVLALDGQQVNADLFLLTDMPVNTSAFGSVIGQSPVNTEIPGAPGFKVAFQEAMNPSLYHDLSTDRNMSWVRSGGWFTYLSLNAPDTQVNYDLGVSPSGIIRVAPFGAAPMSVVDSQMNHEAPGWLPRLPLGSPQILLTLALILGVGGWLGWLVRRSVKLQQRANQTIKAK